MTDTNLEELRKLQTEFKAKRGELIEGIKTRTIEMAELRYKHGKTLQQIADMYGLTRQRVHIILKKGI
jgi:DNA-directed RNA polymerase specialized sigma subunit